ncbi:N-acetylmuramoyl-L-alanine amidase [Planktothrix sp. FACHB-1355]|uniref:N-acetylmuramoyl-L-alanine amidase n=1 Tax=Aerosakkonema funiforme FACHB-1375 TaxID=2949571 RepID=A0A926VBH6_9CYAN|nr:MULTISPECIES: N-acetylmuramoyl-L-alanine amidase [Oscillatoriales]MBD2179877.1 N-acetylmuramoyl-L-alanine amidase [Aerosakkonema funiforme FACHB-1375]MBD3558666.1 N-acetylmuramoyl-L-alanine amidase [Planktothrix sp. FACHB-1355]
MRKVLGLVALATVVSYPALAAKSLYVAFPPANYQTASDRIFFLGTAPAGGSVLVNGKVIQRSPTGHFAPSLPLRLGNNIFTFRYGGQVRQIRVTRVSSQPSRPVGLAFGKDSLKPGVDVAKLSGELICFSAIAPPNATVSVKLGNQTIPLVPQSPVAEVPSNYAALTGQYQTNPRSFNGQYQGCAKANAAGKLGRPQFQLSINGKSTTQMAQGNIEILSPTQLEIAEVIVDSAITRTGAGTDYSRLTPLPKGTQATVTGREGKWLRLDYGGWIEDKEVRIIPAAAPPTSIIRTLRTRQVPGATEVIFPLQVPVPVSVQQGSSTLAVTLYNTTAQTDIIRFDDDPIVARLDWQQVAPSQVQYTFNLKSQQQWGYQMRYESSNLVLTLRHSPNRTKESQKSLSGIKILLDPGHGGAEPGAAGPNGYLEKNVNLTISKLIKDRLVAQGATVYMTREDDRELSLQDRVAIIDKLQPAIAISIHHNSLPDNGDAENTKGFSTFWYHPQAHSLAMFIQNYVVQKLGRPEYGVFWNNLALTRPATAPSILLELGFMSNPNEFELVMNPQEQQKMADAIADGITEWLRISH